MYVSRTWCVVLDRTLLGLNSTTAVIGTLQESSVGFQYRYRMLTGTNPRDAFSGIAGRRPGATYSSRLVDRKTHVKLVVGSNVVSSCDTCMQVKTGSQRVDWRK